MTASASSTQEIVERLRATLEALDSIEPASMAAIHVQWAIDLLVQAHLESTVVSRADFDASFLAQKAE